MIEKVKTFKGGYSFGKIKGAPKARVRRINLPQRVIIPLKQGFSFEVPPVVKKGEKVKAGQIIGLDDNSISSPIHSSINGVVIDCELRIPDHGLYPATCNPQSIISKGMTGPLHQQSKITDKDIRAVVIEGDGTLDWMRIGEYLPDIQQTTPEGVFKTIYMAGVTSLGASGIPTPYKSSPISPDKVKNVLINGTNSEPFSLPVSVLLKDRVKAFIIGLKILDFFYPDADIDIALDSDKREDIYSLFNELNSGEEYILKGLFATGKLLDKVIIHPLKPKYPQGAEAILVETILGTIPVAKGDFVAIDYGIVILDIQDVFHIYEAVVEGKPLIERVISAGGPAYHANYGINVRIGTSIKTITEHRLKRGIESRIILNSIMTSEMRKDKDNDLLVVTKSTRSIIAVEEDSNREFQSFLRPGIDRGSFSNTFLSFIFPGYERTVNTNLHGESRACIFCNFCEYICPVDILPFLISKYVTHNMEDETLGLNIFDCIECALCSYVCPSKIPLLKHIQEGKQRLISSPEQGEEKDSAA